MYLMPNSRGNICIDGIGNFTVRINIWPGLRESIVARYSEKGQIREIDVALRAQIERLSRGS